MRTHTWTFEKPKIIVLSEISGYCTENLNYGRNFYQWTEMMFIHSEAILASDLLSHLLGM